MIDTYLQHNRTDSWITHELEAGPKSSNTVVSIVLVASTLL